MTQLSIAEAGPACDPERSQWLTPMSLAREIVSLARTLLDYATQRAYPVRVLEPSAGRGNLVRAVRERCPSATIDAVELDFALAIYEHVAGAIVVSGPARTRCIFAALADEEHDRDEDALAFVRAEGA